MLLPGQACQIGRTKGLLLSPPVSRIPFIYDKSNAFFMYR